jgi:hypothetical protein
MTEARNQGASFALAGSVESGNGQPLVRRPEIDRVWIHRTARELWRGNANEAMRI